MFIQGLKCLHGENRTYVELKSLNVGTAPRRDGVRIVLM